MEKARRQFLSDSFSVCSAFGVGTALTSLHIRLAHGAPARDDVSLVPVADEVTGLPLLRLPEGFRYISYGWTGDPLDDGTATPPAHDGMGVVHADGDVITLVRNHEVSADSPAVAANSVRPYDPYAGGGCTSLKFDTARGQWLSSWLSCSGTSRNCAGGTTPWGTWLTCEETLVGPHQVDKPDEPPRKFEKTHGWIFEVPPDGSTDPVPLMEMGRFVHEAIAVDHRTGIVYQTEDRGTSGFYRFVPNRRGELAAGGQLEMAEVVGQPDLRRGVPAGASFDVRWHKIADPYRAHTPGKPEEDGLGVFTQGRAAGGTVFARLEGCWFGNGLVYFDSTSGGAAKAGQIWQYDPQTERLSLLFESPAKDVLNMPDNLCVSPQGGLVLCEDNNYGSTEHPQRIFLLSQQGELRLFAENNVQLNEEKNGIAGDFRTKEWAGANFSPDGRWLFVNAQSPGITFAITGPWQDVLR